MEQIETKVDVLAQEARQKAGNSGVGYANVRGSVNGHDVWACAFTTSRSRKYQVRWMVNGRSVPASRLADALA